MLLNNETSIHLPANAHTLASSRSAGRLPRLSMTVLRAQLATGSSDTPADVRRAAIALLTRVGQYYQSSVDYCHSGMLGGSGEIPRAMPAPQFAVRYAQNYQGLRVDHPVDGPLKVWEEASAMCLNSALSVAQWEITAEIPEAGPLLRAARIAALSACRSEAIAGAPWGKHCRRFGTPGIRKRIGRALREMPAAWLAIHPDSGQPLFFSASDYARMFPRLEAIARDGNRELQACPPDANLAAA